MNHDFFWTISLQSILLFDFDIRLLIKGSEIK